jgi:hypothetical protein
LIDSDEIYCNRGIAVQLQEVEVPRIDVRAERTLQDLEVDAVSMFTEGADPLTIRVVQINDDYVLQLSKTVRREEETLEVKLGHVKQPSAPKAKANGGEKAKATSA